MAGIRKTPPLLCHTVDLHFPAPLAVGCEPCLTSGHWDVGRSTGPRTRGHSSQVILHALLLHLPDGPRVEQRPPSLAGGRATARKGLGTLGKQPVEGGLPHTYLELFCDPEIAIVLGLWAVGVMCHSSYATLTNMSVPRNTSYCAALKTGRKQQFTRKLWWEKTSWARGEKMSIF